MLTIAAINLQSGIGTTKGYRQYIASLPLYLLPGDDRFVKKAAQLLAQERVDIALCTEVNEISFRSTRTSHVQTIEATLKPIASAFFPTIKTGTYLHEGNAIFSAYPLTHIHAHSLVRRIIPRVLGEVMTTVDGVSVTVLVTHLSLSKKTRMKQIASIARHIQSIPGPVILGGDFNEVNSNRLQPLLDIGLQPCTLASYPSWRPRKSLDYLFLSHHFTNIAVTIPVHEPFSDHAPLIIKTTLK